MTPDQIQSKLNELQAELDKLKQNDHYIPQPGEVALISDTGRNFVPRIFTKYDSSLKYQFACVVKGNEDNYKQGFGYVVNNWLYCRRLNGEIIEFGCDKKQVVPPNPNADNFEYIDLLPDGYEFCKEEEAEKWVKVEKKIFNDPTEHSVGHIVYLTANVLVGTWKPIRPIVYHVAVHEAVTAVPDPYQVDWENAPEYIIERINDEISSLEHGI